MTKKIFRSTVAVGLAVLLASLVIIMGALYGYFGHVQERQLHDELTIAAAAMEQGGGVDYLRRLPADEDFRITWLKADGTVLYDTRSDAGSMVTTAVKDGDYYSLNGRKCFISGAPLADYCIVYAKTDMSRGNKGISAFIVDMKAPGVSCGKHEAKMGLVGYATSDVVLEDVRVHKSDMLGKENMGFINAMKTLDGGRLGVSAQSIGLAQGCLDEAIKYSKERVQFGKPICKNQAIAFMLADMATKLTAAKELVYMAAQMKDRNDPNASMYCSMAKYFASETCNEIAAKAVQIHGGYGYIKEYPVERKYRDCRVFTIYEGTSQVQQMVISGNLLK